MMIGNSYAQANMSIRSQDALYSATCLLALRLEPGQARVEVSGGALAIRLSALIVGETHIWHAIPVVHRGVERLKRGLPSSK